MNILDENVLGSQRQLLRKWRVPFRRHPQFDTQAKRMGNVIRASHRRLAMWRLHAEKEVYFDWTD
jgi:hypothetical protein